MIDLRESGHPLFRGTSALFRGALKSKGGGQLSIHNNGDPAMAELLFRIVTAANLLSIYGAVLDWCDELAKQISDHSSSSAGNLKSHPLLCQS